MKIFINHTNHNSADWSAEQKAQAAGYGYIYDLNFPDIPADADENYIKEKAENTFNVIKLIKPEAVLCQGEYTYVFALVNLLKSEKIKVLAACSNRVVKETVTEEGETQKISEFKFVRFREY